MWTQLLGRLSCATSASFLILENYTDLSHTHFKKKYKLFTLMSP